MRLFFVSSGPYPEGGASTNRHLAYAKGLVELGHLVEFVLLQPQSWTDGEIVTGGIKITNAAHDIYSSPSKLGKIRNFLTTMRRTKQILYEAKKTGKIDALILLDSSSAVLLPLLRAGKKLGIKVLHERTEYPFVVADRSLPGKLDLSIYLRFGIHKFDGIYVINHALKNYFSELTKNKIPVRIINMIVDPSRFELNNKEDKRSAIKTITYCGKFEGDKDGVPILIEAFSLIAREFPDLRLRLIGSLCDDETRNRLIRLVEKLGITGKVSIEGPYKRDEIPVILNDADFLALARPNNAQAEGGFPTKLGEYLATGNPVIVTRVGEIDMFLKDKVNAYVAEPDSPSEFAEKIREALLDQAAKQTGLAGRKLVYNEFNYLTQAENLEKLIVDVRDGRSS
jgi:glycosyltransferase involved in cell wall biosynthesis